MKTALHNLHIGFTLPSPIHAVAPWLSPNLAFEAVFTIIVNRLEGERPTGKNKDERKSLQVPHLHILEFNMIDDVNLHIYIYVNFI